MRLKQGFLGLIILPFAWFLAADVLTIASPTLLPDFFSVLKKLYDLLTTNLWSDLGMTTYRWLLGFSIGVVLGIFSGLIIGMSKVLQKIFEFPIEFLRALPVTAIFPLFLLIFGIGDSSKIAMAFSPTFLLMLVNTAYGVTLSDPTRRRMAKVFGASIYQIYKYVVIKDALPQIFIGLRLSLAQSLIVTVVSEMFIGTDFGLGQRVYESYLTSSITTLYALLIVLGFLGYFANKILLKTEAKIIFWTGK